MTAWIQTFTGQAIDLDGTLDPRSINLQDIAHGLANTCRYAGQSRLFYSVAEHSVNVMRCARDIARQEGMGFIQSRQFQRAALMHDAQEAYLGDMPTPLKNLFPAYKELEGQFEEAISSRFGLNSARHKRIVKRADLACLFAERDQLLGDSPREDWAHGLQGEPWRGCEVLGWSPALAKQRFLWAAEGLELGH